VTNRGNMKKSPAVNIILFICTLVTVFFAGFLHLAASTVSQAVTNGIVFASSTMAILVSHEAGHYIMARKNGVAASLPYFVPFPPFISLFGTLGAIIVMKGRIKSRDALMEVGAAGPLAGMVVAIPILFIGLSRCPVVEIGSTGYMEGQSLLYIFAKQIAVESLEPGKDILLDASPMAFAGWFGMLITMLNLFPIGQLDGGHIFYALFGRLHSKVSIAFHRLLFLFGISVSLYFGVDAWSRELPPAKITEAAMPGFSWVFLGIVMALVFRKKGFHHPPTDDDKLSKRGKVAGIIALVVFIVTFMPVVMRPVV